MCALCTGTKQEQPLIKCKEEGHTIVPAQDAIKVILGQLHPLVKESLSTLRDTMALRSANKERVLSTLNALAKFMEELKLKVSTLFFSLMLHFFVIWLLHMTLLKGGLHDKDY